MKDMSREYEAEALRRLGLPDSLRFPPVPLPQSCGGLVLDREGRYLPIINSESEGIRPGDVGLPAALEPLRRHISDLAVRQGKTCWLCLSGAGSLLIIKDAGLISDDLCKRLEDFLSLRPCLCPERRPGLGLFLDESGAVFPAAP